MVGPLLNNGDRLAKWKHPENIWSNGLEPQLFTIIYHLITHVASHRSPNCSCQGIHLITMHLLGLCLRPWLAAIREETDEKSQLVPALQDTHGIRPTVGMVFHRIGCASLLKCERHTSNGMEDHPHNRNPKDLEYDCRLCAYAQQTEGKYPTKHDSNTSFAVTWQTLASGYWRTAATGGHLPWISSQTNIEKCLACLVEPGHQMLKAPAALHREKSWC